MTTTVASNQTATTQVHRIYIKATAQAIWDAIIKPEWAEKYGYGCRVEYDLTPGGAYRAFASEPMKAHGAPDVIIVGAVIEADPPRKLVQTWHPLWDPSIAAEAMTHDVSNAPLTAAIVSGQERNAGGGWSFMISDLKTLLETGAALAS